ncbi:HAD-IA family hydrolase [Staphylococcus agnetis]|uniref:HAD-IA family hydrolase n=1 Tax=Staphylococcus agnetis TaxID=985762 RepID=UPI001430B753|nr:HAD-IA family hydrolase [Staphylococcus agnetis]NJH83233.1 HAD-IA family hydrolase [Staphylococcus agnetis]
MSYKVVLLDFDDTLVDFHDAEVKAYTYLMDQYKVPESKRDYETFKKINQAHWEAFQRNELTKSEVLSHRFIETFQQYEMSVDGHEADVTFRDGVTQTQKRRIAQTDLMSYVDHLFVSDEMGAQKPSRQFFDIVFNTMPEFDTKDFIIIGDSLTSDIQGGINGGIDTVWFNHKSVENNTPIMPTYTINTMHEIDQIL